MRAWADSPARFREDANAEDDLALGGYRDRLVVELAQNAADAAFPPADQPGAGRLAIRWDGDALVAANTGAPLTADGVAALASLRASAKRGPGTVGRFGVGFAAVAAVADEVVVAATTGAVRFDRAATRREAARLPGLAVELGARSGRVPLLRLPWPDAARPAEGFDTEVRVAVRPDARERVEAMLDAVDAALLLVLPGLVELELPGRRLVREDAGDDVRVDGVRWRAQRGEGELAAALLAGRPVEERTASRWSVTWAVPVDEDGVPQPPAVAPVVHAPTPTDDPLSLPVLLAATLPLAPDRRRVQPGPLTEAVLAGAATALVELVPRLADDPSRLLLVPPPLAAGEVDAVLGRAVLAALRDAPVLAGGRRPRDAVVLEQATPALTAALDDVLPGLLPSTWSASRWATPLARLGVRRLALAELTELLAGLDRPPSWWRALYEALAPDRDALGALPVPLSDGRLAPSPRGLLLADLGAAAVDLAPLGVRMVHPEAAHPLLLRLGAVPAEPRPLLEDPRVRAAVETAMDEEDPAPVTEAVLALVGAAGVTPGEYPWLADLPLRDVDGRWRAAGELLLPGGPLADVVDLSAGFGVAATGTHPDLLAAVGVLRSFAVVPVEQADDVDALEDWLATLDPGEEPEPVVRDLDLVRPAAWPRALDLLEREGLLRLPYVRWWLAREPVLDGRAPRDLRLPGADPLLVGLYDPAPGDAERAALLGARVSLASVLAADPDDVVRRLADPTRSVGREQLRAVHAALARAEVAPPDRVRGVRGGEVVVVDAGEAVVVDRPDLLARVGSLAAVPVPLADAVALADALDLALASELLADASVELAGAGPWSAHLSDVPGRVLVVDRLRVPDADGAPVEVDWARVGDVDVVTGMAGMARAAAWRLGAWERRHELLLRLRGELRGGDGDLDTVS